ncbi:MAG TPA: MlaD family protein [Nocardioides sp.]|nr:MlaD family protein [Nocardioides sp.]
MSPTPVHRDDVRKFAFGIGTLAVLVVVALVGGIVQTGGALPGKHYTYVTARFTDVGILKTGKDVRTGGVRVGTVSDIAYDDGDAVVTLRLDGDQDVYADATATVANVSALGKKFVDLEPGTPSAGAIGADGIPLENTTASTSLEDVLGALDPRTRKALRGSVGQLATGLNGHSADLNTVLARSPELLGDLDFVTTALTSPQADLTGMVTSADQLVSRFRGREDQIRALLRNADQTLAALAVDDGDPLGQTVAELPSTLSTARGALDALYQPVVDGHRALDALRPGAEALGRSTPELRAFLRDAVGPLHKVPGVADSAEPVLGDLSDTLDDARPLVGRAATAVQSLDQLLYSFAPYAGDAGRFFSQHDLLSGTLGSDDKHYFAAMLTGVGLFSVDGLPDPLYGSEPYPAPGTAWNHATITDVRK